jgi:hypothetical protein
MGASQWVWVQSCICLAWYYPQTGVSQYCLIILVTRYQEGLRLKPLSLLKFLGWSQISASFTNQFMYPEALPRMEVLLKLISCLFSSLCSAIADFFGWPRHVCSMCSLHLLACPTYTSPHSHGTLYIPATFRFMHVDIFLHRKVKCLNVVFHKKPADCLRQCWYCVITMPASFSFCIWDLCFGTRAYMTSLLLYSLCLKVFSKRLSPMPRLSSLYMPFTHWMRVDNTAHFYHGRCSDLAWR